MVNSDHRGELDTPMLVLRLNVATSQLRRLCHQTDPLMCSVLYSMKANSIPSLMRALLQVCYGISTSSYFEARLARDCGATELHCVPQAIGNGDDGALFELCSKVTINSLSQLHQVLPQASGEAEFGLRVNPGVSVVNDVRYDPCRMQSKLGVSPARVQQAWRRADLHGVSGIHFHTACECESWEPLLRTVKLIEKQLAPMLYELEWINLGGGYEWNETTDFGPLEETIDLLTNTYGLKVFLEPGSGIVNSAGSLISSVVDIFESDGKTVAILDTTVNHLPEVFEYQYEPDIAEHVDGAPHEYILAGCSCLAGDLFGEYTFDEPLDIGSRLTFEKVGAYSLVKANMFNGVNLPSIYCQHEDGHIELIREFTYEDYLARCGGETHAVMPARI